MATSETITIICPSGRKIEVRSVVLAVKGVVSDSECPDVVGDNNGMTAIMGLWSVADLEVIEKHFQAAIEEAKQTCQTNAKAMLKQCLGTNH